MPDNSNLEKAYRDLAKRLDAIPNGFPSTESGSELRLLAKIYTPEQAAIAAIMRLTPESAEDIGARVGLDGAAARNALKNMARNGLIVVRKEGRELRFGLMPFVVGVYEEQLPRMDVELARLFEDYFRESYGQEVLSTGPSVHRVVTVQESIDVDMEVFPFETASNLLEGANSFGIRDCICRVEKKLLDEGCDAPLENCLIFHPVPNAFDRSESIRSISKEQAQTVLREAREAGLVHSSANVQKGHGYICNCCTCCCGILRGMVEFGSEHAMARADFIAAVEEDLCTACGICVDTCPFEAISMPDDVAVVSMSACMGCGLCVVECPSEAISMHRRPESDRSSTPRNKHEWLEERAKARDIDLKDIL